jgi:hypothetical protein
MSNRASSEAALKGLEGRLDDLEELYKDIHSHPELSMQEQRTAGLAAERLKQAGFDVTEGVGKTGGVGLLEHGAGPVVKLRADMDALPVKEQTGLPYASSVTATDADGNETPVMHACGLFTTWAILGSKRHLGRRSSAGAVNPGLYVCLGALRCAQFGTPTGTSASSRVNAAATNSASRVRGA